MLRQDLRNTIESTQRAAFEDMRLDLMADHGFEATSTWITDGAGSTIYAMEGGRGECPKILIHGGLSEGSEWWSLAGRLEGRVVIPDRPGCGLTHIPTPHRDRFRDDAVRWLDEVVDALGAPQVDLIGNSLGGYTSLVYALAHPERVRRVALVGAPAGLLRKVPFFIRLWGNPVAGPIISRRPISDPEKMRAVYQQILAVHADRLPRRALEVGVAGAALPGVGRYALQMLQEVTTLRGILPSLLITPDVAGLPTPTLFVWGEEDAFGVPEDANRIW
ncbi:hypothetical protein BH23ACT5_BH23ACT5_09160 [soil metagenome]